MTELQVSPSGYRGQDEVPGLPTCSPNTFTNSYPNSNHGHPVETSRYKRVGSYSQDFPRLLHHQQEQLQQQQQLQKEEGREKAEEKEKEEEDQQQQQHHYHNQNHNKQQQQSALHASSLNEYYYKKTDKRISENKNNVGVNSEKKSTTISSYNEGYKKNTPDYKNDSGYIESIDFENFSLPLNEKNEVLSPPTPPARDASSLKGVCYGPGHEKFPSWPSVPESCFDDDVNSIGQSGSHRSKSWADHTNYPKEKSAQYTRPLAKRPNTAFTQQLKTVMERCEKIPAETYESWNNRSSLEEDQPRLWPRVDREGNPLGDTKYIVPSPPEREQQHTSQALSHADLEAYVRSYQDPQVAQVDIYHETTLTQAGLEEYTRVQHSQQASYAQSEGYHSYVSSVDSTTNTPFLDRLRRDSEAVSQRALPSWEDTSREGRDSVVTTSSGGSTSSSETLKWHGSMSDVSVSSGLPPHQVSNSNAWPSGSISNVRSVNSVIGIQKSGNNHENWQSSTNNVNLSIMNNSAIKTHRYSNNNKWQKNKWQMTMNNKKPKQISSKTALPAVISHCTLVNDVCKVITDKESKWLESSIDDESSHERGKGIQHSWESFLNVDHVRYNQNSRLTPHSSTSHSQQQLQQHNIPGVDEWNPLHGSMSDVSQANTSIHSNSKQLIAHSARVQTPQRHHSESVLYLDRERNQRKLYPVSTTQPQESGHSARISPVLSQQGHLSVAERINELEKHQYQMRYTYLDPDKRHRVSDPTLKAIQKKALLSFYERHHQSSWRSEPQLAQDTSLTIQSQPPQPPPRPRPPSSRRASCASDYASGTWHEQANKINYNEPSNPKHQHSNSCGSLSTDLSGPVIVGPIISIDDWVPERPPKKPHLRAVYNDRMPSPDLPPPSPPTVTENEVVNCDEPLPPPPPLLTELNDRCSDHTRDIDQDDYAQRYCRSQQIQRSSTRRFKHNKRIDKSILASEPTHSINKSHINDQNMIRGTTLKSIESKCMNEHNVAARYVTHRMIATGRSSLRYPSADKLIMNGRVSSSRQMPDEQNMSRPLAKLPDLVSQRYSDSGNQRPAPQVPVESRVIRQESMRVESTRIDVSGLLRRGDSRLEHCIGQRPQPQVPKNNSIDKNALSYVLPSVQSTQPNYSELSQSSKFFKNSENHGYSVSASVKTSYEANAKLLAESNPQKYHEPPKYGSNHHQRHVDQSLQKNYYALPSKYMDTPKQVPQPQCPDKYARSPGSPPPPPLAPRQNIPGRKSLPAPPRPAPLPQQLQGSQSKASYLAYKRERGAPDSEGSYKRTMSPTARLEDWPPSLNREDSVFLRVTPHHQHQHQQLHYNSHNYHDLPKSHSVDALHHRIEERTNAHSVEVIGKLSHELGKKFQASDMRPRSENNNNDIITTDRHEDQICHHHYHQELIIQRQIEKKLDYSDRITTDSFEMLNDKNQQPEREHIKSAVSCEQVGQSRYYCRTENETDPENSYKDRITMIEMTSRNVEFLNRQNSQTGKPHSAATTTLLDFDKTSIETIDMANNKQSFEDKSLQTSMISPKFVKIHENGDGPTSRSCEAVRRRSGSCSSSNSSSTRSSIEREITHSGTLLSKTFLIDSSTQNDNRTSLSEIENIKRSSNPLSLRSKVSSPAQTEKSWTEFGYSQECMLNNNQVRRISSSDSRSSYVSSVSKTFSRSSSPISLRYSPINNKISPCVSPQPGIEGLTLVQRTEIVLRVNATRIDVASQTEIMDEDESINFKDIDKHEALPLTRRKLPEEIECEELSRDLVNHLGPNDKLTPILVPAPEHKKPTDYVSGLFRVETTLKPRLRQPASLNNTSTLLSSFKDSIDEKKNEATLPTLNNAATLATIDINSSLSLTSAYFTTSEGKARFLTRYSQDMTNNDETSCMNMCNRNENDEDIDLKRKKEELVLRLDKKVIVLRAEQEAVREEGEINEILGTKVSSRIAAVASPAEASKYRLHVEEIGKITSLLLGLSGRLARAENALHEMTVDHPERRCLEGKRDKLLEQLEEAKILKCNIDKRSVNVSAILSKYLNNEEFADYQHFITMKTKLIMDGREIQDKVKLGEEQLAALKEAIGW